MYIYIFGIKKYIWKKIYLNILFKYIFIYIYISKYLETKKICKINFNNQHIIYINIKFIFLN
jgi:hypothetical protein